MKKLKQKKWRIPRKKKKLIPKGIPYCYSPISYEINKENLVYKVKYCPFLTMKDVVGDGEKYKIEWCKLVEYEVDDSCKVCDCRMGF